MSDESREDAPRPGNLESRWPVLAAVLIVLALTLLRPLEMRVAPRWALPAVEVVLLTVVIARHPARISPRAALLRAIAICAVGIILADTLAGTVRLVDVLIQGGTATNSADQLLAAGAIIVSAQTT